ncbi:MAG: hydroxyacid dehydrogenase [Clostridia bacterium]|nr:hydroxyacid dehydrogenase [Clostridia bacterium]
MKALINLPRNPVFDTFFTPENIALAESLGEMVWNEGETQLSKAEVMEKIADCDVYVTGWGSQKLDAEVLSAAKKLKLHTHLCGSVSAFDDPCVWDAGVKVISGNRYFAESVAEGTLGYMLSALRDIPYYTHRTKTQRVWRSDADTNQGLAGKKIGIVSYGAIGRHMARILSAFRTDVRVYDIKPLPEADVKAWGLTQVSLEAIFAECDIITLHTPLISATYHMVGRELLSKIKPGALLVNTSRGAVIDQAALVEELETGRFRAFLDVFEEEPVPTDNKLFDLPNVMMIPHMGGPTVDLRQVITHDLILESKAFVEDGGELPNEITKEMASTMSVH